MKCKKCGCDTLIKNDDWYKCANCGAEIFDTEVQLGDITSPTKEVESLENNHHTAAADEDVNNESEPEKERSKLRDAIDFCIPIGHCNYCRNDFKNLCFCQRSCTYRLNEEYH